MFNHAYFKTCIKKPPVRRSWSDDDYDVFDGDQQGRINVHAQSCERLASLRQKCLYFVHCTVP
jgi:hypothetical protein